jgi:SOS-response transcriptional repressor LexA
MFEIYFHKPSDIKRPFLPFPVPAGEAAENTAPLEWLSLDDYVGTGESILYIKVKGDSMTDANIECGDLLVVNREQKAENGAKVFVRIGDKFTVKKWKEIEARRSRRKFYLVPANSDYNPVPITPDTEDFEIIGVITFIVKKA